MGKLDFGWFLTVPGMLITGGVLLLIVALILLLVVSKKSKKEKNIVVQDVPVAPMQQPAMPGVNNFSQNMGMDVNQVAMDGMGMTPVAGNMDNQFAPVNNFGTMPTDVMTSMPEVSMPDLSQNIPTNVPAMQPIADNVNISVEAIPANGAVDNYAPIAMPSQPGIVESAPPVVNSQPVSPVIDSVPAVPSVENAPAVQSAPVVPNMPVVDNPAINSTPVAAPQAAPVIYGGNNPTPTNVSINEPVKHQIYGGADPLHNTQTIPKITNNVVASDAVPVIQNPQVVESVSVAPVTQTPNAPVIAPVPIQQAPVIAPVPIQGAPDSNNVNPIPVITSPDSQLGMPR